MKLTDMKYTGLLAAIMLTFASFNVFAEESHMAKMLEHTQAAVEATDGKAIAEHAEVAKTHAVAADEHLDAGIKNLDEAIKHGKLGHTDLAKKAAEEALTHLKAAQ